MVGGIMIMMALVLGMKLLKSNKGREMNYG